MLKGIHPLLTSDLLRCLAAMGHGDEIAIVDANFPARRLGPVVIDIAGASAPQVLAAVLTVLPLDTDTVPAAVTMQVIGDADAVPAAVAEFTALLTEQDAGATQIGKLDRMSFYERARGAAAIVRTGELRPYGNVILVKGVVNEYGA